MAYDVKTDGTLGKGRVFFDSTPWTANEKGLPDGMKVDQAGNLFATGPGGVNVFAPDGTVTRDDHMSSGSEPLLERWRRWLLGR